MARKRRDDITDQDLDDDMAANAELTAFAQWRVIKLLRKLPDADSRQRVIDAAGLILEAERLVPGVLDMMAHEKDRCN